MSRRDSASSVPIPLLVLAGLALLLDRGRLGRAISSVVTRVETTLRRPS